MSVYFKETKENLDISLRSILEQTYLPSEIIIMKDGPIPTDVELLLEKYVADHNIIKIIDLKENVGLGRALNIGLTYCSYDLVGRMDSDDIAFPNRFEQQVEFMDKNLDVSVLGALAIEFNKIPGDLNRHRKLPMDYNEVLNFAKFRNPLNHPTVIFRKAAVIKVGSYLDMPLFEDYYLWIRLLNEKFKIVNLNIPLLHFRIGNDMVGRRHGVDYMKKEIAFLRASKSHGFITPVQYMISIAMKAPFRIIPKTLLEFIYKAFLR
ncbi:glycosyltransferase [Pedobacter miscanthi]|nr:glycosyltransferase [Pedobacter miscanthi]